MPNDMKHKNGALVQHSDKWSDSNRRKNSYSAGQGSRASRNQGYGQAGINNTKPSDEIDTSKMNPEEKLKYFQALGLLKPDGSKSPKQEPRKEATPESPKAQNPVKELSDRLMKIFAQKPNLINGIVQALKSVPKEQMKDTAQRVLDSMNGNNSTDSSEVFSTVMGAIKGPGKEEEEVPDELDFSDEEEVQPAQAEPKEGSIDWIRKIHKYAFDNSRFQKPFDSYNSYRELIANNHDQHIFQDYLEKMTKNEKIKPLYDLAMHKLNDFDPENGEDSKFMNIGDAVFSILKDGEDVQQSSGSSTEEHGMTRESLEEMVEFMKSQGYSNKQINENILKYK